MVEMKLMDKKQQNSNLIPMKNTEESEKQMVHNLMIENETGEMQSKVINMKKVRPDDTKNINYQRAEQAVNLLKQKGLISDTNDVTDVFILSVGNETFYKVRTEDVNKNLTIHLTENKDKSITAEIYKTDPSGRIIQDMIERKTY